ncbi:MAG: carboxylesterase family protein [Verrucomicrobiota bacterium]
MKFALTLAVPLLLASGTGFATDSDLRNPVRIEWGLVEGVANQEDNVVIFKGIPYAAPPVGNLRWREPQPPAKWEGIRKADQFGAQCPQPKGNADTLPWSIKTPKNSVPRSFSEDCLYLNVWTPAKSAADKLAVLFYIAPGSFPGEGLAKKGILVVTLNHRLGIIGGMGHPELTKESPLHLSGNYGMLDMIAALRWVHDNIAAFGGDPDKVTLAGYSVGSTTVHYLTTSPVAKGLFRGAICMSFPYDYLMAPHKVGGVWQKEQEGLKFAAVKKAKTIAELRQMPAGDLIANDPAVNGFTRAVLGSAFCLDGWALPSEYPVALDKGLASDVPTLTGLTADDSPGCPPVNYLKTTVATFPRELVNVFGEKREAFTTKQAAYLAFCPLSTDQEARELVKRAQLEYRMSTVFYWATRRARKNQAPVYTYLFEQAIPCKEHPEFGAFHTSDLVYEFNNLNTLDHPWTEADRRVADQVSSYWVNFVKTGNPNGENLPAWKAFDPNQPATMALGAKPGPRPIAGKERLGFYRDLLER